MQIIKEVMTQFPYSIESDAHPRAARSMMERLNIHHMPVKTEKGYTGLITNREIRLAADLGAMDSDQVLVGDVCQNDAKVVAPDTPLDEVLMHLSKSHDDAVLVVEAEKLVGIFTTTDVCRCYAEVLRRE